MDNLISILSNRKLILPALLVFWLTQAMVTPGNSFAYKASHSLGSGLVNFVIGYIFLGFVLLQIMVSVYYFFRPNVHFNITQISRINFTALTLALFNASQIRLIL